MMGSAVFDGPYRYHLARWWGPGDRVVWVMLNPSTADAVDDDPTIRRCISFSQRAGFGGLHVVNLFGLIATRPVHLRTAVDPIGPGNRTMINHVLTSYQPPVKSVVAAWGAAVDHVPAAAAERDHLLKLAKRRRAIILDLGTTMGGHPRHPLYLPKNTEFR